MRKLIFFVLFVIFEIFLVFFLDFCNLVEISNEEVENTGVIDFSKGYPNTSVLPLEFLKEASLNCFSKGDKAILRYAHEKGPKGFLETLATFLNDATGYKTDIEVHKVKAEQLMATTGCSQGLSWVCRQYTKPGDLVFVEEATYFLALEMLAKDNKLSLVAVNQDDHGLVVDEKFESMCQEHKPKMIYIIPTHHNPTGRTIPEDRRKKLIQLSRKYNFLIIADEVYQLINFGNYCPPPSFVALDNEGYGTVISLGTFSKILGPGLRIGWIQTKNKEIMESLSNTGELLSGGNGNVVPNIVQSMIELGLQRQQLETYNKIYEERTNAGIHALKKKFGEDSKLPLKIGPVHGGYFVWAELPNNSESSKQLLERCTQYKVGFKPGDHFSSTGALKNYIRFCFVHWTIPEIEEGINSMAQSLLV